MCNPVTCIYMYFNYILKLWYKVLCIALYITLLISAQHYVHWSLWSAAELLILNLLLLMMHCDQLTVIFGIIGEYFGCVWVSVYTSVYRAEGLDFRRCFSVRMTFHIGQLRLEQESTTECTPNTLLPSCSICISLSY